MANKDLKEFMLSIIESLESEHRFGTAHVYRSALRSFTLY